VPDTDRIGSECVVRTVVIGVVVSLILNPADTTTNDSKEQDAKDQEQTTKRKLEAGLFVDPRLADIGIGVR
jgi:hypothetical protein